MCVRNSSLPPPFSHIEDEWQFVCNGSSMKGRILDLKGSILWVTFYMCPSLWSTSWPCLLTQNSLCSNSMCMWIPYISFCWNLFCSICGLSPLLHCQVSESKNCVRQKHQDSCLNILTSTLWNIHWICSWGKKNKSQGAFSHYKIRSLFQMVQRTPLFTIILELTHYIFLVIQWIHNKKYELYSKRIY